MSYCIDFGLVVHLGHFQSRAVVLFRPVVHKDPAEDDHRAEAAEEGHCVPEEEYGEPDEQGSLYGVGNTARETNEFLTYLVV